MWGAGERGERENENENDNTTKKIHQNKTLSLGDGIVGRFYFLVWTSLYFPNCYVYNWKKIYNLKAHSLESFVLIQPYENIRRKKPNENCNRIPSMT